MEGEIYWRDKEKKAKLRGKLRVYRQRIQQPQYQQMKVKGNLRVCGNGEFRIFSLLHRPSQNTNLSQSYETSFSRNSKQK